jgi:predicted MFS family arabinose efflux permease
MSTTTESLAVAAAPPGRRYPLYVLGVLLVVYTFNFIDRIVLGVLVPPIKAELGLTDTQLGLLGGTAFALFYTALGIPVGWLADRFNRVWIMTAALALWSAFTAVCGFTTSFVQLFLARLGVGIGEAGGVAPAYSFIADYFPPEQRARALSVYSFGIPIGSALGLIFGGVIASMVNWRAAFMILGVAGVLLAPLLLLTVREPLRGGLDGRAAAKPGSVSLADVARVLVRKPSFWGLSLAAASSSITGYGLFFWLPSFFMRSYGLTLIDVSLYYGGITLIGGIAGVWLGGWLADRYGTARKSAYAYLPAAALALCIPFYFVGVLSNMMVWSLLLFIVPTALALVWPAPTITAIQHLVRAEMRAVASAIFLFVNNLIGLGLGTLLIGALSDGLASRFGSESLRYAILAGLGFYALSVCLFLLSARRLERDWER